MPANFRIWFETSFNILYLSPIWWFVFLMYKNLPKVDEKTLPLAAVGPVICAIILRWTYNFSGLIASITYDPFTPSVQLNSYLPTWPEWAVGIGVISYWLLGFSLAARFLPFHSKEENH